MITVMEFFIRVEGNPGNQKYRKVITPAAKFSSMNDAEEFIAKGLANNRLLFIEGDDPVASLYQDKTPAPCKPGNLIS